MRISVIKSANEVAIGSLQITNKKLAKLMIRMNDMKNNLRKRRQTHWVKVSFEGMGSVELGDEPICIGDYDEYPLAPEIKVIIPIEELEKTHKQYVCSTLNTPILLQNKTLTNNEEIIIIYTEILSDKGSNSAVNEMLLNAMKKCLFEYQMKVYSDYCNEPMDRQIFDKRIQQILNILPDLELLMANQSGSQQIEKESIPGNEMYCDKKMPESNVLEQGEDIPLDHLTNTISYIDIHQDKKSIVDKNDTLNKIIQETHEDVKWVKIDLRGKNNK